MNTLQSGSRTAITRSDHIHQEHSSVSANLARFRDDIPSGGYQRSSRRMDRLQANGAPLMQHALKSTLTLLADETSSVWGQEFFNRFVRNISIAFDIDHVLIAVKADEELKQAHCCALWADGVLGDTFTYELKDSACLRVLQTGETLRCFQDAHLQFPRNQYIVCMPAQCYLGVPIKNAFGATIGLIAVLDRKPLPDPEIVETVLQLFKGRIAADLERMHAEQNLYKLAHEDSLTSLPNRHSLMAMLSELCHVQRQNSEHKSAVLFLDVDNFKYINDEWGHWFGDRLIVEAGKRLRSMSDLVGEVARFGGDEFVIVLPNIEHTADAIHLAERIQDSFKCPFNIEGRCIVLSISIGIVVNDTYCQYTPDILLRNADIAMYQAKALDVGSYKVFEDADYERLKHRSSIEADLRRAIKNNEFVVRYQPIIALNDQSIAGFEALVTWQHPERGMLYPDKFIPVAEEVALVSEIDRLVLKQACVQFKAWQRNGWISPDAYLSVNLSVKHLVNSSIVEYIDTTLAEVGMEPKCLNIEITESDVMKNTDCALSLLQSFRSKNMKLSIDDFGTGYSSLSYLHQFPFSHLKIDKSFIHQMDSKSDQYKIVKTIALLSQSLGMKVVAEGVETQQQLQSLKQFDCDFVQGYLFSKPMFSEDVQSFVWQRQSLG